VSSPECRRLRRGFIANTLKSFGFKDQTKSTAKSLIPEALGRGMPRAVQETGLLPHPGPSANYVQGRTGNGTRRCRAGRMSCGDKVLPHLGPSPELCSSRDGTARLLSRAPQSTFKMPASEELPRLRNTTLWESEEFHPSEDAASCLYRSSPELPPSQRTRIEGHTPASFSTTGREVLAADNRSLALQSAHTLNYEVAWRHLWISGFRCSLLLLSS
jgi:hypothetical protein